MVIGVWLETLSSRAKLTLGSDKSLHIMTLEKILYMQLSQLLFFDG